MNCYECGTYVKTGHTYDGHTYCCGCKLKVDPPKLTLKRLGGGNLYDETQSIYNRGMDLKELERCGWFLRRRTERQEHGHPGIFYRITHYYMEFLGTVACRKCNGVVFPKHFKTCFNRACGEKV